MPPIATFDLRMSASLDGHIVSPGSVAWSCDSAYVSAWGKGPEGDATVAIWAVDLETSTCRPEVILEDLGAGIECIAWSPVDPEVFAVAAGDQLSLFRLHPGTGTANRQWQVPYFMDPRQRQGVAFSPTGREIVLAHEIGQLQIRDAASGALESSITDFDANDLYCSSYGTILAIGYVIELLDLESREVQFVERGQEINCGAWAPDGSMFCTGDTNGLVHAWDRSGRLLYALEGQLSAVVSVGFSHDGRLLLSQDRFGALDCWDVESWQRIARIDAPSLRDFPGGMAVAPGVPLVARFASDQQHLEIYLVGLGQDATAGPPVVHTYSNAKVVLIGDTGVGKSGLSLVLTGRPYAATDSTHARQVTTFDESTIELPGGGLERREILLWDMAGQPGYRLIHQLHLSEVAVALIVFDARNENDPFTGVRYWARSLRQKAGAAIPMILVAARTDRGGVPVSRRRIGEIRDELGLAGFFETSARENRQIAELADAIRAAIDWSALPQTVSTDLFESIKQSLLAERNSPRILATSDDLYRQFLRENPGRWEETGLRAGFDTCVRLLELRDLVRRLSFGGFVLLRPELLDAYASALIDAARAQPDGLGFLAEDEALAGAFPLPDDMRLPDEQQRLLLIAMVEELLRHDVALRLPTEDGVDLVLPSQLTVDQYATELDTTVDVIFRFDGPVQSVYATLAVRLAHVAAYKVDRMWRNTSIYHAVVGGRCGLRLREAEEGRGELSVFFDDSASEETRYLFEEYVRTHLSHRAVPGTVGRERVFRCSGCDYELPAELVRRRQARQKRTIECPACDEVEISLLDREDRLGSATAVRGMNATADEARDRAAATATIRGKEETDDYDVMLSYHSRDRAEVSALAERLRAEGILPWMDDSALDGGTRWYPALEEQIRTVRAAAIFLGPYGLGPWQEREIEALEHQSTRRPVNVIPVFLSTAPSSAALPTFLSLRNAVDLRHAEADPFARLVRAIRSH